MGVQILIGPPGLTPVGGEAATVPLDSDVYELYLSACLL